MRLKLNILAEQTNKQTNKQTVALKVDLKHPTVILEL